jgi:hypothetical protein
MSTSTGPDPIDRLRAADPVHVDDVPDASLARVSARIQEHIVTENQDRTRTSSNRRPLALIGGAAIAGALVVAVALGSGLGTQAPPQVAASPDPTDEVIDGGVGLASCIMYDPAILPTMEIVFDGTVTAVDGDQVTFDVNTGWKGAEGRVTLTAPHTEVSLLGPMPDFTVGERYLVTAAGTNVNACGYTLDYDAATAATWAAAFGG